jgi:hypothetical protein
MILKRIFVTLQNKINDMKNIFENIIKVFLFVVMVSLGTFLVITMSIFMYTIATGVYHELFK